MPIYGQCSFVDFHAKLAMMRSIQSSKLLLPAKIILLLLKSDTRRLGAQRITDYRKTKRVTGNLIEVTDFYGCNWKFEEGTDFVLSFGVITNWESRFVIRFAEPPSSTGLGCFTQKFFARI